LLPIIALRSDKFLPELLCLTVHLAPKQLGVTFSLMLGQLWQRSLEVKHQALVRDPKLRSRSQSAPLGLQFAGQRNAPVGRPLVAALNFDLQRILATPKEECRCKMRRTVVLPMVGLALLTPSSVAPGVCLSAGQSQRIATGAHHRHSHQTLDRPKG